MNPIEAVQSLTDLIAYYEAIPEAQWRTESYADVYNCRCANGHLKPDYSWEDFLTYDLSDFDDLVRRLTGKPAVNLALVNDGRLSAYPQSSPKQRVLAYLTDLKNDNA